jgi:fructokinase
MSASSTAGNRAPSLVSLGAVMVDLMGIEPSDSLDGVETFKRSLGGASINVATTAVRLGLEAAVVCRIGDDAFGRYVRDGIRARRIRDEWLQVDPHEATTLAFFAQKGAARTFQVVRGADRQVTLTEEARAVIERAAALHATTFSLSMEPARAAVVEAIELAHAAGRVVSLDPNYRAGAWPEPSTFMPLLQHILPLTTVIKPSLRDAEAIWGRGLSPGDYIERFHGSGARQVLLTLGKQGVIVSDGVMVRRLPAVAVETPDAVGAGDAFTAGAITALIRKHDLLTAAQVGTVVAAYMLRAPRDTGPLPRWAALLQQATADDADASLEDAPPLTRKRNL